MVLSHSMSTGSVMVTLTGVKTLKPYLMQKNLFKLFVLTDSRDAKALGASTCAWV